MDVQAAALRKVGLSGPGLGACPEDLLAEYGYIEDEFYVTGVANRYRIPHPLGDAQVLDGGWPYKTRMVVRRPADAGKFNGTVIVEWTNVSLGQDTDLVWAASHEYLMSRGYACASLSAQHLGVEALNAWSPERYEGLSVAVSNTDPATGGTLDPTGDALSWDIFSQSVAAVRRPRATEPFSGLAVKNVIACGESQAALRLTDYYNSIDPLHRLVDAVVFYDAAGPLRADSPTKAVSVATEIGIGLLPSGLPAPDSANCRRWEVAGTSHASLHDMRYVDAVVVRDGYLRFPDGTPATVTGQITGAAWYPLWSPVPAGYVVNAAFDHARRWIQEGAPAPSAPPINRDHNAPRLYNPAAGGESPALAQDAIGMTTGGIQLAEHACPAAHLKGAGNTGPGSCWLAGSHRWFSDAELAARYQTPEAYLRQVTDHAAKNAADGFLLPDDAQRTISAAAAIARAWTTRGQAGTTTVAP
jgi:hypothetical protein